MPPAPRGLRGRDPLHREQQGVPQALPRQAESGRQPQVPLALTLKMLSTLRPEDLKKHRPFEERPDALSTAARKLSATRNPTNS